MFFSYQNIFQQYPTNRKKVMTGFRHGLKGESQKGGEVATPQNVMTFQFQIIYAETKKKVNFLGKIAKNKNFCLKNSKSILEA